MTWYFILFCFCFCFFIIKTILSFIVGDTDIDFDADGDIDFDLQSMFSFKGILHFLLGFSSFLTIIGKLGNQSFFMWYDYFIAIIIGFIFMIGLFYLYKLMMKFNHGNYNEINIEGYTCSILTNLGNGNYKVLIHTPMGSITRIMKSFDDNLKIGSEHKIIMKENQFYIF